MPGRSPHIRSPTSPPHISGHIPSRGRVRSPDRHLESRGRERHEYRPTLRRSRSPVQIKTRPSYSPPMKRKVVSPGRAISTSRRSKLSKSPGSSRVPPVYAETSENSHNVPSTSGSDRYRGRGYEKEKESSKPVSTFRAPEVPSKMDIEELKRITVQVTRGSGSSVKTEVTNPGDIILPRRAGEGSRPLFSHLAETSSRDATSPTEEYRRIVALQKSSKSAARQSPEHSRERERYASPPYEESRTSYYPERASSPYESRHRSPRREEYVEVKEKHRERRGGSRDDLRRDIEVRRRDERRYSPERSSYERESDLRLRINEKRSEPHQRYEEREYSSRRYESDREKHGRTVYHSPPPPKDKRHAGSADRRDEPSTSRGEWESERRKRPHSREREERGRERYESFDRGEGSERSRRPQQHKTEYEPKKAYKTYEPREFVPIPTRGRGLPPMRPPMRPPIRGRGIIHGIPARGFPMRGAIRGIPRVPFMRGFPPRFFPPY